MDLEWFNKMWYIMLMHKITATVQLQEGDRKAKIDFQSTWKVFLDQI